MAKKKIKWQPIVKIKGSLLFQWYVFKGGEKKYCQLATGLDFAYKNGRIVSDEISIDLNEFSKIEKLLTIRIKRDKDYLQNFIDRCYYYCGRLIRTAKNIRRIKNWSEKDVGQLLSYYLRYQESILELIPFLNTILVMDAVLKKNIIILLKTELNIKNESERDILISKLVIPKKKSFFVKQLENLIKIVLKTQIDSKTDIKQDIQRYLEKYAWMSCISYLGQFQTEQDVMKQIKTLLKENPQEQLAQSKQIKGKTRRDYNGAFEKIKGSNELVKLIDFAREFIYLQTYRLDVFFLAHYYAYPLLEEIGKRLNLEVEELVYLTGNEIVGLLQGKKKISKKEINNRINDYALTKEGNKYTLLSGEKLKKVKVVQKLIREIVAKGIVANRGRATGRAKLINEIEDIPKVKRGDIIVSPMTHPKLMPALIRASGIITDFGGMLCHAALISRELGIPCIVGTKKATKVFKDGDLVELNAYDGIARKLKK